MDPGWRLRLNADSTPAEAAQLLIGITRSTGRYGRTPRKVARHRGARVNPASGGAGFRGSTVGRPRALNRLDAGMPLQVDSAPGIDSHPGLLAGGIGAPIRTPFGRPLTLRRATGSTSYARKTATCCCSPRSRIFRRRCLRRTRWPQLCAAARRGSGRSQAAPPDSSLRGHPRSSPLPGPRSGLAGTCRR